MEEKRAKSININPLFDVWLIEKLTNIQTVTSLTTQDLSFFFSLENRKIVKILCLDILGGIGGRAERGQTVK